MTQSSEAMWKAAFDLLETPAAVTRGQDAELEIIQLNGMLRELLPDDPAARRQCLADHLERQTPIPFPGQPSWILKRKAVGDGAHTLWQASRRTAEDIIDRVADWVASATIGDLSILYFDADDRLRAYNGAVRRYFPHTSAFPRLGATFAEQLDGIIETYDFGPQRGSEEQWREDLLHGYRNPGKPKLGLTPTGRWALATTTRMGDGSTMHLMNDVTAFRERDQQVKLFMRNAHGILFSRRNLDKEGDLKVWGDMRFLESEGGDTQIEDTARQASWFDLIDERDRGRYVAFMQARKPGDKPYTFEFRYRNPRTGNVRWIRECGWTVVDGNGRNFLDAIYFDITENKLTTEALRESEERFRDFAEMASDWYFELDADLRMTFLSDRYESVGGEPSENLIGRSWREIVEARAQTLPPEEAAAWHDLLAVTERHEPFREWQLSFVNARGETAYIRNSGEPQFDEDGVFQGYRGIGQDITPLMTAQNRVLKSLEHAEQANAAKSAFIANVSHELRTPLNAILGFSTIMSEEMFGAIGNERYRSYAGDIASSGQHLLSLVNDLLDISKVEAGRYSIEDETLDLGAEVDRVAHLLGMEMSGKDLVRGYGKDAVMVRADRRAVRQMLINLLGNALKFTGADGRIEVDIGLTGQGQTFVDIADNGVGISREDLGRVLEPFGRAQSEIAAEGTGLGLPLTRRLMELHGGLLTIDSTPGEGTRVRLIFPADRAIHVETPRGAATA